MPRSKKSEPVEASCEDASCADASHAEPCACDADVSAPAGAPAPKAKRPLNAYMLYSQEQRPKFDKTMKVTEVAKAIGAQWKELSDADKQPYKDRAAALKEQAV